MNLAGSTFNDIDKRIHDTYIKVLTKPYETHLIMLK